MRCLMEMTILVALIAPLNRIQAHTRLLAESDGKQVHLLELYSSESCSSCPPADQWFAKLKLHPELWSSFVPVVFHVDYWNYLDWKDSFAEHSMTQRQIDISNLWVKPSVYTPGVILDGQEWKDWSLKQLPNERNKTSIGLKITESADFLYSVEIKKTLEKNKKYRIRMALLGFGLESNVTSGENKGRKLMHDFLVLQWNVQDVSAKFKNEFKFQKPNQKLKRLAIVAWLEEIGSPVALQAAGQYL